MRITVVHNQVSVDDAPDDRDVLLQAEAVKSSLISLGHKVTLLECTLDLEAIKKKLKEIQPQVVFNLVESLGGYGSLIHLFPSLLEAIKLRYTGSQAETIRLTSNKTEAKRRMCETGLPTPVWVGPDSRDAVSDMKNSFFRDRTWIIKSLWEHASVGLDENSVVSADSASSLANEMTRRSSSLGGACFAEEFIQGREFNLSLLEGNRGPQVLPVAEICFEGFDPVKPQIVDYRAKWEEDSFEYQNTLRRFEFSENDNLLVTELKDIALRCWEVFGLRGYARVDFRVDASNRPWILEVNANPCLSPDAGFAAALSRAGISFKAAVNAIIEDADFSS